MPPKNWARGRSDGPRAQPRSSLRSSHPQDGTPTNRQSQYAQPGQQFGGNMGTPRQFMQQQPGNPHYNTMNSGHNQQEDLTHMRPSDRLRAMADRIDAGLDTPQQQQQPIQHFHGNPSPMVYTPQPLQRHSLPAPQYSTPQPQFIQHSSHMRSQSVPRQPSMKDFRQPSSAATDRRVADMRRSMSSPRSTNLAYNTASPDPRAGARALPQGQVTERRLPQALYMVRQQLRWLIKLRLLQVGKVLAEIKKQKIVRKASKFDEVLPGLQLSVVKGSFEEMFGQELVPSSFPGVMKMSQLVHEECGDFVQVYNKTSNNQLYVQVPGSSILRSDGENKAAKKRRAKSDTGAFSCALSTLKVLGFDATTVLPIIETTLAADAGTVTTPATTEPPNKRGESSGSGAVSTPAADSIEMLAASDANAMGILSDDEAPAAETVEVQGKKMEASPRKAAAQAGGQSSAGTAVVQGSPTKSPRKSAASAAAATSGKVCVTEPCDLVEGLSFAAEPERRTLMLNMRRLLYKLTFLHLDKTPYRQLVPGKEADTLAARDIDIDNHSDVVLVTPFSQSDEDQTFHQLLHAKTAKPNTRAYNGKPLRGVDLTNICDRYAEEYGSPPELGEYSEPEKLTWLLHMAALPAIVRKVVGQDKLVLLTADYLPCAPAISAACRHLRNSVVTSLLELVPTVRHMLGQLPGKTQHHVGTNYVVTMPCKNAAARIAQRYTTPGLLDAMLKQLHCTSVQELLHSVHLMDLLTHHDQAVRPAFDPIIDLRMALDLRLTKLSESTISEHANGEPSKMLSYMPGNLRQDHLHLWGYTFFPSQYGRANMGVVIEELSDMIANRSGSQLASPNLKQLVYPSNATLMRYHIFSVCPPTAEGVELDSQHVLSTFKQSYGFAHPACNAVALSALIKTMLWVFSTSTRDGKTYIASASPSTYYTLAPPPQLPHPHRASQNPRTSQIVHPYAKRGHGWCCKVFATASATSEGERPTEAYSR